MTLPIVALTDTFDVWRTRTNQLVTLTNDIDDSPTLYFTSNTLALNVSSSVFRKGNVFFQLATATGLADQSTANLATASIVNTSHSLTITAFNRANAAPNIANTYATSVGTSGNAYALATATTIGDAGNTYAVAVGAAGNSYANLVGASANSRSLANASTVYSGTLQFSTSGSVSAPSLTNVLGANTGIYWPAAGRLGLTANGQLSVFANTSGNVGIGTTNTSYKLFVAGDIYATGDITAFSSEAIKTDVVTITNALNTVESLRGVSYTRIDNHQRKIGLIAQEVQKVLPEVVVNADGNIGVSYQTLTALLIEAVKELSEKVTALEKR